MKKYIRKVLFVFLLIGVLPAIAISCDVLFYDAHAQTEGIDCLAGVWAGYMYPAQLCYEWLAKQNAGEELNVPVSQSECDGQFLLALIAFKYNCKDESNK